MKANDYQTWTKQTAVYPTKAELAYLALGLTSEAGEIAGKIKKIIRDNEGVMTEEIRLSLCQELGDNFWYLARLCDTLGTTMEDVMDQNKAKLEDRLRRGKIQGSGDNR